MAGRKPHRNIERIKQLIAEGIPPKEIAKMCECALTTVHRIRRAYAVRQPPKPIKPPKPTKPHKRKKPREHPSRTRVRELLIKGWKAKAIAAELGISKSAVHMLVAKINAEVQSEYKDDDDPALQEILKQIDAREEELIAKRMNPFRPRLRGESERNTDDEYYLW